MSNQPIVLVVDDLPLNRMMVILALKQMGCQVLEASDGAEAVQACRGALLDLIVMDCQMPVMNGLVATGQIRADDCQTPIIAYTTEDNRDDCLEAGMDDYLCKLAPLSVLKGKLQFWLSRAAA